MPRPVLTPLDGVAIIATDEIADLAVTTAKLAAQSVTAAKIANNTITAIEVAPQAIGISELADGAVTTIKVVNGNITAPKLDPAIDPSIPWQPVAYASGYGGNGIQLGLFVKKVYNVAWIAGTVFRSGGGGGQLGTLPVGYRPVVDTAVCGVEHSAAGASVVTLDSDGTISAGINVGQSFTIAGPYILF